jgi:hypothetical protein
MFWQTSANKSSFFAGLSEINNPVGIPVPNSGDAQILGQIAAMLAMDRDAGLPRCVPTPSR